MLTRGSNIFKCTREQAEFIASCANLRYNVGDKSEFNSRVSHWLYTNWKTSNPFPEHELNEYERYLRKIMAVPMSHETRYSQWEDRQTGGGGARICWCQDIAWVSNHSGYPQADIVAEVCDLFRELKCEELDFLAYHRLHPIIYGFEYWPKKPIR